MSPDILLISDLDDTLLGDSAALQRFADYYSTVQHRVAIVYASGRFFESACHHVQTTDLPEPLALIGGVGSEIRRFPDGEPDSQWIERMSDHWSAERVRELLASEPDLQLQPEDAQSEFKVSYFFDHAKPEQLERLKTVLREGGIHSSVIYSSERDLDFLPEGVDKGSAATFLAQQLDFDTNRVLVAGNSGNDSRLFEHKFWGVIVANAHPELKRYRTDPRVYLSSMQRADGVRDGLEHWLTVISKRRVSSSV